MSNETINRRKFLTTTAMIGAASLAAPAVFSSCNSNKRTPLKKEGEYYIPELADKAIDGRELKVGLIGCGGRGTGAVENLFEAANGITLWAIGDVLDYRVDAAKKKFAESLGQTVEDERCFVGFDSYQKVIDSGVDMVIVATPPLFRAEHFKYSTEKGVHAFLEKPIAVDAKSYRTIMATAKQAEAKGLSVVTGTQRHHQRCYVEAFKKIQEGYIGEITGGTVYWNQGMLWYVERQPGMTDRHWMIRDWVNWKWLSGDHIVEQHVHNIDVFLWMSGLKPVKARGFGARHRRITGDQYDMFSVDFEFENGIRLHSMCRQIDGTSTKVGEFIQGTKGSWNSETNEIQDLQGNVIWKYDEEAAKATYAQHDPYVLEHVDWVNHIRKGEAHEEATLTAISSLAAVMGRESAYSGKELTWDEMSASDLNYMPENIDLGDCDMSEYVVKVPGTAK